jgi:hypothetical protein
MERKVLQSCVADTTLPHFLSEKIIRPAEGVAIAGKGGLQAGAWGLSPASPLRAALPPGKQKVACQRTDL